MHYVAEYMPENMGHISLIHASVHSHVYSNILCNFNALTRALCAHFSLAHVFTSSSCTQPVVVKLCDFGFAVDLNRCVDEIYGYIFRRHPKHQ